MLRFADAGEDRRRGRRSRSVEEGDSSSSSSSEDEGAAAASSSSDDEDDSDYEALSAGAEAAPSTRPASSGEETKARGGNAARGAPPARAPPPARLRIQLGSKPSSGGGGVPSTSGSGAGLKCHVCGRGGHCAGFAGSVYVDCPFKPCYLCRQPGHTTATCPYRIAPDHGVVSRGGAAGSPARLLPALRSRADGSSAGRAARPAPPPPPAIDGSAPTVGTGWRIEAAILRLHPRRVTALDFVPGTDSLTVSADKRGYVAVWDHDAVTARHTCRVHAANVNALAWVDRGGGQGHLLASSGSDGRVRLTDVEARSPADGGAGLLDLNPGGWVPGVTREADWLTVQGLAACPPASPAAGCLVAGGSDGCVYVLDPRCPGPAPAGRPGAGGGGCAAGGAPAARVHRKGKVNTVSVSPADPTLVLSAGNDWKCVLSDLRCLGAASGVCAAGPATPRASPAHAAGGSGRGSVAPPAPSPVLAHLPHGSGVINAAYFSPTTGARILTTATDNRLRVWDSPLDAALGGPPARTIVHSHDFNRYLTPFRAEWDGSDPTDSRAVVGRYISEDVGGRALHPVDIFDAASGALVGAAVDPNLTTIAPVNKFHPRRPGLLVSGSSRSLFAWVPVGGGRGGGADDADDGDGADRRGPGPGGGGGGGGGPGDGDGGPRPWSVNIFDADEPCSEDEGKKKKAAKKARAGSAGAGSSRG